MFVQYLYSKSIRIRKDREVVYLLKKQSEGGKARELIKNDREPIKLNNCCSSSALPLDFSLKFEENNCNGKQ